MKQKRKIFSKFTAVFLAVITLFSMFPVISVSAASLPSEVKGKTISQVLGMNPQTYMDWLTSHEYDNYYIGTPYETYDYRNPNGDCKGAYGKYDTPGQAAMNCTGFVWHVLYKATKASGGNTDIIPADIGWYTFYTSNNISRKYFSSKTEMLKSGYLTKGDIIWMYNGSETSIKDDHHIGIYWGDGKSDILWHSIDAVGNKRGNVQTVITPKANNPLYVVVKMGVPYIKLQLQKSTNNNRAKYTDLSGAQYNIYTDRSCREESYFGYIKTDKDGYGRYGNGSVVNGKNQGANVPYQKYYAQEVIPPKGFALDDTIYEFKKISSSVSGSVVYRVNSKDNPYVKLQLMKSSANPDITNENTCYSLEDAKYNIYKGTSFETSSLFSYITTDSDGYGKYGKGSETVRNTDVKDKGTVAYNKISGNNVELGYDIKFYAQEDKNTLPKGYDWDSTVYEFKDSGSISSDGVRIFRAVNTDGKQPTDNPINDPVGIVLQKKNAVTGETTKQGLEGAIFEVQYYAQEIDKDYDVDTSKGETAPTLESTKLKRTWYIKTNSNGRTRLGSEYLVNNDIYTSGDLYFDSGIVTVPIGTVVIREVKEPDGYTKSPVVFYRQITEDGAKNAQTTGTPLEVPIDEQPATAYIGLHKMNKSGQGVQGAIYGLYTDENATALVSQLTTDTDGKGTFDFTANVNQTYYIKEISAPTGYELDTTIYLVTPTIENATVDTALVQDIYEDSVKGDIIIKKSSNDGIVSNLYFALSDNLGNTYNAVATDSTGTAKYTGLPVYDSSNNKIKYTVKELGFKTTPGTKSYGGFTWTVKAENCIKYKGAYYEGVANNTFSDCEYAYSRYYYGNQTEAIQNSNGYTKTLTDNSSVTYNFNNTVKTTDIEISKKSYDGQKSGFWFNVVDQTGRNYGEIVTNDNGIAKYSEQYSIPLYSCITVPNSGIALKLKYRVEELGFKNPGNGSYYLPDNYISKAVTDYKSDNLSTSTPISFDVYNKPDTGSINIVKSSDDGYIANLWFKVSAYDDETDYTGEIYDEYIGYDISGNAIHEFYLKTDSNGRVSSDSLVFYDSNGVQMSGLPVYVYGMNDTEITYKITELGLKASDGTYYLPERYVKNDDVTFNLLDNRSYTYTCHNSVKTGKLQIQKTSEDNEVEDIWFKVESSLGYTANFVTDSTGYTDEITDLPIYVPATDDNELVTYKVTELGYSNGNGTYTLPSKYITPKTQTVTLNTEGTVKVVHISNILKRGSVTLYKEDSDGNALTGSQWELYNASDDSLVNLVQTGNGQYQYNDNGKVVILDTDNKGKLFVNNLKQGDYYFSEKTPPDGKMTYGKKIEFTISADSDETLNLTYTAIDDNIVMYETGGNGSNSIYFFGFTILAISIAVAAAYIMNNTKKKHGRLN